MVLVEELRGADRRHVSARVDESGGLVIEGQDLGPAVSEFWGEDITESEWSWAVAREDVATLAGALGVDAGNVLPALARRFAGAALADLRPFLDAAGVKVESWSRLGD